MNSEEATTSARAGLPAAEVVFTVERANRSLVLVRRIVADMVGRYARLAQLRRRAGGAGRSDGRQGLSDEVAALVEQINALNDELAGVGCVLKDLSRGLVDFPARYRGRKVWLCWRLGEPAVAHWHEWEAGAAGRRPIAPDFP